MDEKYLYFVSYAHTFGFGNVDVETSILITNMEHIRKIESQLQTKNPDIENIVVLNYKLLRTIKPE